MIKSTINFSQTKKKKEIIKKKNKKGKKEAKNKELKEVVLFRKLFYQVSFISNIYYIRKVRMNESFQITINSSQFGN